MFSRTWLLVILSVLFVVLIGPLYPDAWFQSPVSPMTLTEVSGVKPGFSPLPVAAEKPFPLTTALFWSSPWPWIAVGLALFGGLAWGLTLLLRRLAS